MPPQGAPRGTARPPQTKPRTQRSPAESQRCLAPGRSLGPWELRFFAHHHGQRDFVLHLLWIVVDPEVQAIDDELALELEARAIDVNRSGEADLFGHSVER